MEVIKQEQQRLLSQGHGPSAQQQQGLA